jgi:acylphosphatase
MPLWKIIIEGKTAYDVQGVNLRENVITVAYKNGIKCKVWNKKRSKKVEIVCRCENIERAEIFKNDIEKSLKKNPLIKDEPTIKTPELYMDCGLKEEDINDYEIEREDDLTEMVWALQNAGRAFLIQGELIKKMHVKALKAELEGFKEVLGKIDDDDNRECFTLVALETCLKEPPWENAELIAKLHTLYRYAKTINFVIRRGEKRNKMPVDEIPKVLKEIGEILDEKAGVYK